MITAALLLAQIAAADEGCEIVPYVDRHVLRPAMDARAQPDIGWTIAPGYG